MYLPNVPIYLYLSCGAHKINTNMFSIPLLPFCGMDGTAVGEVMPALRRRVLKYPHFSDSIRVDFPTPLLPNTFSLILLSGVDVGNSWRT